MRVSAQKSSITTQTRVLGPESALLFAVVLFGISVRMSSPGAGLAALTATLAVAAWFWMTHRPRSLVGSSVEERTEKRLLLAILAFALLAVIGWSPSVIGPSTQLLERLPGLLWAVLAIGVFLALRRLTTRPVAIATTIVTLTITLVVGLMHLNQVEGLGLDVNLLHTAAADAIASGENPYSDAVVVPDGAPTAEPGDTITGYPYPPVTIISYALGEWSFSDPRYTSLASWMVVLGLIGIRAARRKDRRALYVMLLLAALPGWPLILRAGWTEPLSLALMATAFIVWPRSIASGLILGLGLASKQYFLVTAPVALLHRDEGWLRRIVIAGAVVTLTIGAAMALDFPAFWSAAVEFHTTTPVRTDSSNLVGLLDGFGIRWAPPTLLGPLVGLVVAIVAGRLSRSGRTFMAATALALAASFLLSSQAFANYWFLIAGIAALAAVSDVSVTGPEEAPGATSPTDDPAQRSAL